MPKKKTRRPSSTQTRVGQLRKRIKQLRNQLDSIGAAKPKRSRKRPARTAPDHPPSLTNRELQVLKLTADELQANQIAKKLGIGTRTVETYRASMMSKLGCRSIIGLAKYAWAHRIVPLD